MAIDTGPGPTEGGDSGNLPENPGGGQEYWTGQTDGTALANLSPWDVTSQNRLVVYGFVVSGAWTNMVVTIEGSVDRVTWTLVTTLTGAGKSAVLDIEEYALVRPRISTKETGGSLTFGIRGYAWLRPFEFSGSGSMGNVPDPGSESGAFLKDDGTWVLPGSGGLGDVVGPASSTDNYVARWDGTTGKLLQDSSVVISDAGALSAPGNIETTSSGDLITNNDIFLSGSPGTRTIRSTIESLTIESASGDIALDAASAEIECNNNTLKNVRIQDGTGSIRNTGDSSKVAVFDTSGITTGTTRTITIPDEDCTLPTAADITKLDGIEAGADVTDATNVNAAGAVMESDLSSDQLVAKSNVGGMIYPSAGTNVICGRITGDILFMTPTQVRTMINVEDGADVTDTTNVNAAGATMNTDTDVSSNSYVLDEDDFASDSATKVATQQSIKAYVDAVDTLLVYRADGTDQINNTTTRTAFAEQWTIAADAVSAINSTFEILAAGEFDQTGMGPTCTLEVEVDGVIMYSTGAVTITADNTPWGIHLVFQTLVTSPFDLLNAACQSCFVGNALKNKAPVSQVVTLSSTSVVAIYAQWSVASVNNSASLSQFVTKIHPLTGTF